MQMLLLDAGGGGGGAPEPLMADTGIGSSPVPQNSAACRSALAAFSHLFTARITATWKANFVHCLRHGKNVQYIAFAGECANVQTHEWARHKLMCPHGMSSSWIAQYMAIHTRKNSPCCTCSCAHSPEVTMRTWLARVHAAQPRLDLLIHGSATCLQAERRCSQPVDTGPRH